VQDNTKRKFHHDSGNYNVLARLNIYIMRSVIFFLCLIKLLKLVLMTILILIIFLL